MDISLVKLHMENFKGIKERDIEFGKVTTIKGANGSGKTTVFDAITWLLFDRDSSDSTKFEVRPLDKDGKQIDYVEIKVNATLNVDGKEVELEKVQKQKWVKHTGNENATFEGNVNVFSIDGFPKSDKEFKEYTASLIDVKVFKLLSNPLYFANMPWKEQRDILMSLATSESDVEIAKRIGGFEEILSDLEKASSLDDIQKKYAKTIMELKSRLAELPVRIDELSKQKVDYDVAELELQKKAIEEKINVDGNYAREIGELETKNLEIEFEINDCIREANVGLNAKRESLNNAIFEKNIAKKNTESEIGRLKATSENATQRIEYISKTNAELGKLYKEEESKVFNEDAWKFDESSTICSMCGQVLPEEKIEKLKSSFERNKAKAVDEFNAKKTAEMKRLFNLGAQHKAEKEGLLKQIDEISESIKNMDKELKDIEVSIATLNVDLSNIPERPNMIDNAKYNELVETLNDNRKTIDRLKEGDATDSFKALGVRLTEIESKLAEAMNNAKVDERIEELTAEQREVSQKIATSEKYSFLLDEFIKSKLNIISDSVNSKFGFAKFCLFKTLINGGIEPCCEVTVDGVPYNSLNTASKMHVGLDIINTLSKIYDTSVFVFLDNRESVTEIPTMLSQTISLYVDAEKKELEVEHD